MEVSPERHQPGRVACGGPAVESLATPCNPPPQREALKGQGPEESPPPPHPSLKATENQKTDVLVGVRTRGREVGHCHSSVRALAGQVSEIKERTLHLLDQQKCGADDTR